MFTFPVSIMASKNPNPWAGWTGVANGADYIIDNSQSYSGITVIAINSTQFVALSMQSGGQMVGWVGTITGTAVMYGSRTTLPTTNPGNLLSICQVSTGTLFATFQPLGTQNVVVQLLTVSGTTLSFFTPVIVDSNHDIENSAMEIVAISSTKAVLYYYDASNTCQLVVVSLSGSVLTPGTPYALIGGSSFTAHSISATSTTQIVLSGTTGATSQIAAIAATVSGTTIGSSGSLTVIGALSGFAINNITQSSIGTNGVITSVAVQQIASPNNAGMYGIYMTVTSNVITHYTPVQTIIPYVNVVSNLWILTLNTVDAMIIYWDSSATVFGKVLKLSGNIIQTTGNVVPIQSVLSQDLEGQVIASQTDPFTVVLGYVDNNSFSFTKILKSS